MLGAGLNLGNQASRHRFLVIPTPTGGSESEAPLRFALLRVLATRLKHRSAAWKGNVP